MTEKTLLAILKSQEVALQQPALRCDVEFTSNILHGEFMEFGRSGAIYSRDEIMGLLASEDPGSPMQIWSQNYRIQVQDENLALLLYKSAHVDENNQLSRHTLRSSLWKKAATGWQMIFHQGTPTAPFEAAEINESSNG